MCGIFALLNNKTSFNKDIINSSFIKGVKRGPEGSFLHNTPYLLTLGFHRLAINGLTKLSDQPITINGITLICNGEIYNYKQLYEEINIIKPITNSDCEIIIHLYKLYGIEQTLTMLDGVFSFVLCDNSDLDTEPTLYIARDPFGVRPLYSFSESVKGWYSDNIIGFASELKVLSNFITCGPDNDYNALRIIPFTPGTYSKFQKAFLINSEWKKTISNKKYHNMISSSNIFNTPNKNNLLQSSNYYMQTIIDNLDYAVSKRVIGTTERPIACLLSGGLDSSLITALVNKYYTGELETYSIGMMGSEDLKNAKIVAEHLGTKHHEIILTPEQFFDAIPEVIEAIESYDTTTVRASVGNYLIGKYISNNSRAKVVFNGDGSDELTGGYIYFLKAPNNIEFDRECRRLLTNIHTFDVLRSDKSISSNGLEPRTPFLDKTFVDSYLNVPLALRNPNSSYWKTKNINPCEKLFLRKAIGLTMPGLLPDSILYRTKEAFSDGVSGNQGSWFQIIQNKLQDMTFPETLYRHNPPVTNEQKYYRTIYDKLYPNTATVIPYFWMPKYVKANDCSARTLDIYTIQIEEEENKTTSSNNLFTKLLGGT
tara:strand:- start:827 stop:2617 length:1791 start_codon:yes stop_codon:yes gene_type:complete